MSTVHDRYYDVWAMDGVHPQLIGRLAFPFSKESSSGTHSFRNPLFLPKFQYATSWLTDGFSLGHDLPLVPDIQRPQTGLSNFQFLLDREVNNTALELIESAVKPQWPEGASDVEKRSVLATSLPRAFGAIALTPTGTVPDALKSADLTEEPRHLLGGLVRLNDLERLLHAWQRFERGKIEHKALSLLAKTCGLPGRRLNPLILKDGRSVILRVRGAGDVVDTPFWKGFALTMAKSCGIPTVQLERLYAQGEAVSVATRLDRNDADQPLLVLSASTLAHRALTPSGRPQALTYLAMADILNREGASPREDLKLMFKRLLYTHWVSPGVDSPDRWQFERTPLGWRLSPAHALDWQSPDSVPSTTPLTMEGRTRIRDVNDLMSWAPYFGLTVKAAKTLLDEMQFTFRHWEDEALAQEADPNDLAVMGQLFFTR